MSPEDPKWYVLEMSGTMHSLPLLISCNLIHMSQSQVFSGLGHRGSSSWLQRLLLRIQPSPGIVSTRWSMVGSTEVCW